MVGKNSEIYGVQIPEKSICKTNASFTYDTVTHAHPQVLSSPPRQKEITHYLPGSFLSKIYFPSAERNVWRNYDLFYRNSFRKHGDDMICYSFKCDEFTVL